MNFRSKIFVAGHRGLLGSAIIRRLTCGRDSFQNILTRTSQELDLTNQQATFSFFELERPEYVYMCAAKVGGIRANMLAPADFCYQNLQMQNNVIEACHRFKVKKMIFVGSTCIYPREAPNPIKEESLLTGPLEPTNEGYAIAKVAGIKMCQFYNSQFGSDFISAIPTNLYGINDHYDLEKSHLLPSLILKIHRAKVEGLAEVELWGTGK
ncbi:MAG: NAD-dependent epimerase/dehydratase family protein, partial [Proteobacteria bacterium]|nr:NAD-dependent epimerase/dehydratase family protein [Pseudomonadota bacterium]